MDVWISATPSPAVVSHGHPSEPTGARPSRQEPGWPGPGLGDSNCCHLPATNGPDPTRPHPLHSVVDVEVFPRKPEEIHDLPSDPVVAA